MALGQPVSGKMLKYIPRVMINYGRIHLYSGGRGRRCAVYGLCRLCRGLSPWLCDERVAACTYEATGLAGVPDRRGLGVL